MGRVRHASDGFVWVDEAQELFCGEEVHFSGGALGVVTGLRDNATTMDAFGPVRAGEEVWGTGEPLQMWVGEPGG